MSKRRFGISIPEDLAIYLDKLSSLTGSDRSKLVAEALRTYIHDHLHYLRPHRCTGILVVVDRERKHRVIDIDEFKDIVMSYSHIHIGDKCIEIYFLSGPNTRIIELDRKLREAGYHVRYVPLKTMIEEKR